VVINVFYVLTQYAIAASEVMQAGTAALTQAREAPYGRG
jgi:hypothetical protein